MALDENKIKFLKPKELFSVFLLKFEFIKQKFFTAVINELLNFSI